jgi:hypothetical protein
MALQQYHGLFVAQLEVMEQVGYESLVQFTYGTVWYFQGGITNILSMKRVKEKCHACYNSKDN